MGRVVFRGALAALLVSVCAVGEESTDWSAHGGDGRNSKYAPLDQINADNFGDLEVAWTWESIEMEVAKENPRVRPAQFKATPLVVDGVMYLPTSICQIVALDPGTGKLLWSFDPKSYEAGRPANLGFQHRGLSYWSDGDDARLLIATHDRKLWAIDAKTGTPCEDFGEGGRVDLETSLGRKIYPNQMTHTSPVGICNDTAIVGSIVFDGPTTKEMAPGHVRGFDVRTGEMKWIFHTIPQEGEFGVETWEDDSWEYSGNTNVWSMFAVDEDLNHVYLPVSTPTNDMYGGHRLGDNLFAESVVCLDADSGERQWHFQAVHHGLWDYDFPTGPNIADVVIDGKPRKVLAQVSKQAWCYVFDRETGEPIWPIEECDVAPSTVPGERAAKTQPHPTKPAAYDRQGLTEEDLIDFTPELREIALKAVEGYAMGPIFTPPTHTKGTLGLPSAGGGSNWPGAALDPETNILYVPSMTSLGYWRAVAPDPARSNLRYISSFLAGGGPDLSGLQGLPLVKPPYSRVTAIDLDTGNHVWMTPMGDGPRNHPLLKDLDLPPLGVEGSMGAGRGPLVTKTLLFVTQAAARMGSDRDMRHKFLVFDKTTGELLGDIPLPDVPNGNPMTYMHDGKQYLVVSTGGGPFFGMGTSTTPILVALALP